MRAMHPLDDATLNRLLDEWHAPPPPAGPRSVRFQGRMAWWRWFLEGSIRIPVPLGIAALICATGLWWFSHSEPPSRPPSPAPVVSFADFQPVKAINPRTVE